MVAFTIDLMPDTDHDGAPPAEDAAPSFPALISFAVRLWLILLGLFSASRLLYLWDYFPALALETYGRTEILAALVSAVRFDLYISIRFCAPIFCAAYLVLIPGRRPLFRSLPILLRGYALLCLTFVSLVLISDHFYFIFYRSHFNSIFWQFFQNAANTKLVLNGLQDVVPIPKVALSLVLAALGGRLGLRWLSDRHPMTVISRATRREMPLVYILLFLVFLPGTFHAERLMSQYIYGPRSNNNVIYLLGVNPFFPLYRSYLEGRWALRYSKMMFVDDSAVGAEFDESARLFPGTSHRISDKGFHYLAHRVDPLGSKYLERRPKHIVLILLESFSGWVLNTKELDFNMEHAGNFLSLLPGGIYFEHHFAPGAGSIENITNSLLSFPQPRDFGILNYYREAFKRFPSSLPEMLKQEGYESVFNYGDTLAWHRINEFLPAVGFTAMYGKQSFPEAMRKGTFISDGDMYHSVDLRLREATRGTFQVIFTCSNHVPLEVPAAFEHYDHRLPPSLRARLIGSDAQLFKQLDAFRYSDAALGEFLRGAAGQSWFQDTLFIITADHSMGAYLAPTQRTAWDDEKIPLLIYAPRLIRKRFRGKRISSFTTHLDISPTLISLLTGRTTEVQTWGKNLLDASYPGVTGFSRGLSCLDSYCLNGPALFRVGRNEETQPVPADDEAGKKIKASIERAEKAYYGSAFYYFLRYEP